MDFKILELLTDNWPSLVINSKYQSKEYANHVKSTLNGTTPDSYPFPHFVLENFLSDANFLSIFDNEFACLSEWQQNVNDLYSNSEFCDLQLNPPERPLCLIALRDFFVNNVKEWLTSVSGCDLVSNVSISLAKYNYTNILLPHDDQTEKRKFAFVFYLSSGWNEKSGGELVLFNCDDKYRPLKEVKAVLPKQNTLALFEVSPSSWHMVNENLNPTWTRLSLHGWFHIKDTKQPVYILPRPIRNNLLDDYNASINELVDWINPQYLNEGQLKVMQEAFSETGSIKLENFLKPDKYILLLKQMEQSSFREDYLPHRRKVMSLDFPSLDRFMQKNPSKLPKRLNPIEMFYLFLCSSKFAKYLVAVSNLSAYNVKYLECSDDEADENEPKKFFDEVKFTEQMSKNITRFTSFRRFCKRLYQLIDDELIVKKDLDFAVDFQMYFTPYGSWNDNFGGNLVYGSPDESSTSTCYSPEGNVAIITHRRANAYYFIKYINNMACDSSFYLLSTTIFGSYFDEDETKDLMSIQIDPELKEGLEKNGYVAGLLEEVIKTRMEMENDVEEEQKKIGDFDRSKTERFGINKNQIVKVEEPVPTKVRKYENQTFREEVFNKSDDEIAIGDPVEVGKIFSTFVDSCDEDEI